jgi:hypothetical protein
MALTLTESVDTALSTPESPQPNSPLDQWARAQALRLGSVPPIDGPSQILGEIAVHAFVSIDAAKLLRAMRWTVTNGRFSGRVRLEGDDASREAARVAAQRLLNIGYLSDLREVEGTLQFQFDRGVAGTASKRLSRFLNGGWMEAGAANLANQILAPHGVVVSQNVSVHSDTAGDAEYDVLAIDPSGGARLVIECKSGTQVQQHLFRFRAICDLAGATGTHAVFVVREIDDQAAADASTFHDITVVTLHALADHLSHVAPQFGVTAPERPTEVVTPA